MSDLSLSLEDVSYIFSCVRHFRGTLNGWTQEEKVEYLDKLSLKLHNHLKLHKYFDEKSFSDKELSCAGKNIIAKYGHLIAEQIYRNALWPDSCFNREKALENILKIISGES